MIVLRFGFPLCIVGCMLILFVWGCDSEDIHRITINEPVDTYRLTGRVIDAATGRGIPGAAYSHFGSETAGTCDEQGLLRIDDLDSGDHLLTVSAGGYATARIDFEMSGDSKRTERLRDFPLMPLTAATSFTVYGLPHGRPLPGVDVEVTEAHPPGVPDGYATDPASLPDPVTTDDEGLATFTGLPHGIVEFTVRNHDADGDGTIDYLLTSMVRDFSAPDVDDGPFLLESPDAAVPQLIDHNLPPSYLPLESPSIWLLFSRPIDPEEVTVEVTLTQDNFPFAPVSVEYRWTSPLRLEITSVSQLDDMSMDYDLAVIIQSTNGWRFQYNDTFYWLSTEEQTGDCDDVVTGVELIPGHPVPDFDTSTFSLIWPAVPCADGYRIYVRDDRDNPDWVHLRSEPSDYEWGFVEAFYQLPSSFDRYDADGILTPLAGTTVSFCVVPEAATDGRPGEPHAILEVSDGVPPVLIDAAQVGGAANGTDHDTTLIFELIFSEYIGLDSPDPVLSITEAGGDPSFRLDPGAAQWIWSAGRRSGRFVITVPAGSDGSGDLVELDLDGLADLSGNVADVLMTDPVELTAFGGHFDFESGPQGWIAIGESWEWGMPTNGPMSGFESNRCWAVGLEENYGNNWTGSLYSPEIAVCSENAVLSFAYWCYLDPYDDWVRMFLHDESGVIRTLPQITGNHQYWDTFSYDLDDFVGHRVRIEFRFISDASGGYLGFFMDDVRIGCP